MGRVVGFWAKIWRLGPSDSQIRFFPVGFGKIGLHRPIIFSDRKMKITRSASDPIINGLRPVTMETRCFRKEFEFQRYPPKDFCTARYEHKSSKKSFNFSKSPKIYIFWAALGPRSVWEKTQILLYEYVYTTTGVVQAAYGRQQQQMIVRGLVTCTYTCAKTWKIPKPLRECLHKQMNCLVRCSFRKI